MIIRDPSRDEPRATKEQSSPKEEAQDLSPHLRFFPPDILSKNSFDTISNLNFRLAFFSSGPRGEFLECVRLPSYSLSEIGFVSLYELFQN
jgi:hypothetical protein